MRVNKCPILPGKHKEMSSILSDHSSALVQLRDASMKQSERKRSLCIWTSLIFSSLVLVFEHFFRSLFPGPLDKKTLMQQSENETLASSNDPNFNPWWKYQEFLHCLYACKCIKVFCVHYAKWMWGWWWSWKVIMSMIFIIFVILLWNRIAGVQNRTGAYTPPPPFPPPRYRDQSLYS